MLRDAFSERLKQAMRAKDTRTLSTVRLISRASRIAMSPRAAAAIKRGFPIPKSCACCKAW